MVGWLKVIVKTEIEAELRTQTSILLMKYFVRTGLPRQLRTVTGKYFFLINNSIGGVKLYGLETKMDAQTSNVYYPFLSKILGYYTMPLLQYKDAYKYYFILIYFLSSEQLLKICVGINIFSRSGRSQGLLYKHRCHSFIKRITQPLWKIFTTHKRLEMVPPVIK